MGERDLLRWLRRHEPGTTHLIGDDAALLPPRAASAVTTDAQIEGVHFPAGLDPAILARRLLAVNLSDLAAVAAQPRYAFLALAAPGGFDHRRLLTALTRACRLQGVQLAGGDLARSSHVHAVLTMLGERPPRGRWLRRDQARTGDRLWVGGSLGESALGCRLLARGGGRCELPANVPASLQAAAQRALHRHLLPVPQLQLGRWLGRRRRAAGLDVSDGLGLDLWRLCEASGVAARLDLDTVPRPDGFEALCDHLDLDAEAVLLGGGEDYVLLFTLPPGVRQPPLRNCRQIGEIVDVTGDQPRITVRTIAGDKVTGDQVVNDRALEDASIPGWDHLNSSAAQE